MASSRPQGTGGVPGNVSGLSASELRAALPLHLLHAPTSSNAHALIAAVLPLVLAAEGRMRQRGAGGRAKLVEALGAILGGVLTASLKHGLPVRRSMRAASFDGVIAARQGVAALGALVDIGLLGRSAHIRFTKNFSDGGMTTRFYATDALHALAAEYGISAQTVETAFTERRPTTPPKVPHLLILRPFDARSGARVNAENLRLPIDPEDIRARVLRSEIELGNSVLSSHTWEGCQPPRLCRTFRGDWSYSGRWMVPGDAPLQTMSPPARLAIRIDGAAVTEIDVTASQLSILAAAAGDFELPTDPYAIPGYDRNIVKLAVVATLGAGKLPSSWPRRMLGEMPELAAVPIKPLTNTLGNIYPFLKDPGLTLGVDKDRVALRLQFLEASVIGTALVNLWERGIPAVPIHDSLLCPEAHSETVTREMKAAYRQGGIGPRIATKSK